MLKFGFSEKLTNFEKKSNGFDVHLVNQLICQNHKEDFFQILSASQKIRTSTFFFGNLTTKGFFAQKHHLILNTWRETYICVKLLIQRMGKCCGPYKFFSVIVWDFTAVV